MIRPDNTPSKGCPDRMGCPEPEDFKIEFSTHTPGHQGGFKSSVPPRSSYGVKQDDSVHDASVSAPRDRQSVGYIRDFGPSEAPKGEFCP
jgi:hypothetical protein